MNRCDIAAENVCISLLQSILYKIYKILNLIIIKTVHPIIKIQAFKCLVILFKYNFYSQT